MPTLPHNFPTLRGQATASLLAMGAGASHRLVPLANELIADRRAEAETKLGFTVGLPVTASPPSEHLYLWADQVLTELEARSDPNPKLRLAESLGIPTDPRWRGSVVVRRSLPRHRVIARFARERLWEQIWSLNWDCVQENALESIGIKRDNPPAGKALPWITAYKTFVTTGECAAIGESNVVKVIKPHGCVRALVDAQSAQRAGDMARARALAARFLITATELSALAPKAPADIFIFHTLCSRLASNPLVVLGWSMSEEYLLTYLETQVKPVLADQAATPDKLSIVDINFRPVGHARVAACYGGNESTAFFKVDASGFTSDDLLLWLQALYAVARLQEWASPIDRPRLDDVATLLDYPPATPPFVVDWVDNFLPVWVRLCWRCGLMAASVAGQEIVADDILLESRDEHIPWHLPNVHRYDLISAARLLAGLLRAGSAWDFSKYPGGFFRDNELVIPVPGWASLPNDLRGLRALRDAITEAGPGYIERIKVLPVTLNSTADLSLAAERGLMELVAREIPMTPVSRRITVLRLEDL